MVKCVSWAQRPRPSPVVCSLILRVWDFTWDNYYYFVFHKNLLFQVPRIIHIINNINTVVILTKYVNCTRLISFRTIPTIHDELTQPERFRLVAFLFHSGCFHKNNTKWLEKRLNSRYEKQAIQRKYLGICWENVKLSIKL